MGSSILLMPITIMLIIICLVSTELHQVVQGDLGTATSYAPPYTPTKCNGNRQDQFPAGNLFVSVSKGLWDNGAACGRRYRLKCVSGNRKPCKGGAAIDVRVVDVCKGTPCPATILLSQDAFHSISDPSNTKINIEYTQV